MTATVESGAPAQVGVTDPLPRDGLPRGGQRILIVKLFWTTVAESPVTRIVIR